MSCESGTHDPRLVQRNAFDITGHAFPHAAGIQSGCVGLANAVFSDQTSLAGMHDPRLVQHQFSDLTGHAFPQTAGIQSGCDGLASAMIPIHSVGHCLVFFSSTFILLVLALLYASKLQRFIPSYHFVDLSFGLPRGSSTCRSGFQFIQF